MVINTKVICFRGIGKLCVKFVLEAGNWILDTRYWKQRLDYCIIGF